MRLMGFYLRNRFIRDLSYLSSVTVAWDQKDVKAQAQSNVHTHHVALRASSVSAIFFFCCVRNVDGDLQSVVAMYLYKKKAYSHRLSMMQHVQESANENKQSENEEFFVVRKSNRRRKNDQPKIRAILVTLGTQFQSRNDGWRNKTRLTCLDGTNRKPSKTSLSFFEQTIVENMFERNRNVSARTIFRFREGSGPWNCGRQRLSEAEKQCFLLRSHFSPSSISKRVAWNQSIF